LIIKLEVFMENRELIEEIERLVESKVDNIINIQKKEIKKYSKENRIYKKYLKKDFKEFKRNLKKENNDFINSVNTELTNMSEKIYKDLDNLLIMHKEEKINIESIKNTDLNILRKTGDNINVLNNKISSMKEVIDEKSQEIRKYQEGYKNRIDRINFLKIIKSLEEINDKDNKDNKEILKNVEALLRDILLNNDIIRLDINTGEKYNSKLAECIEIENQNQLPEKNSTMIVTKVISEGYKVKLNENKEKILIPAKVAVKLEEKKNK